ncbi:MAG: hypothetical protein L3J08_03110 [Flavobacteriaceae bacterium]|nr:hypothetical protein [Flavobacteriaceae bacterium]
MKERKGTSINIFWIIVVIYLDPGGFLVLYVPPIQRTALYILLLVIAYVIFNFHYANRDKRNKVPLKFVKSYIAIAIAWALYYYIIFYGYNNDDFPGVTTMFLRTFNTIFKLLIVIPIVYFSTINLKSFINILVWSTIFIGSIFIITVFTGIPLIEILSASRGEDIGALKRSFMHGYGIINFVLPITISLFYLKYKLSKKILAAFFIVVTIIFITIYRRDMVGLIEYIIILSITVNYIQKKAFIKTVTKFLNFRNIIFVSIAIFLLGIFTPKVLDSSIEIVEGTLSSIGIIDSNKSVGSTDAARLSFGDKIGIITAIKDNPFIGTGYNEMWYTGDGGNKGWEGSDYIFLAALAMYGVVGLLIFFPFYILSYKIIKRLIKLIRYNYKWVYVYKSYLWVPIVIGLAASAELIKNFLEYPNWFFPIGAVQDNARYFIFFGLLLGSYYNLTIKFNMINKFHGRKN